MAYRGRMHQDGGLPRLPQVRELRAVDRVLAIRDRRARMLGLDAPSKVEATLKVELIVRALEDTLSELGIDDTQVRPVLGRRLRELVPAP